MRIVSVNDLSMRHITQFGSHHASIGGLARGNSGFQLGMLRLEQGGTLGSHPATSPQLLVILSGDGWVSGSDGAKHHVQRGSAVYWSAGELHETTADTELIALVFEAEDFTSLVRPGTDQSNAQ